MTKLTPSKTGTLTLRENIQRLKMLIGDRIVYDILKGNIYLGLTSGGLMGNGE